MIVNASQESHKIKIIVGDFNMPAIEWSTRTTINKRDHEFIETIRDAYLFQHINTPTRHRHNQNSNILDLILSNNEMAITDIKIESPLGKSDHATIKFSVNCNLDIKDNVINKFSFQKGNYERMKEELSLDWDRLFEDKNVDEAWSIFEDKIVESMEKNIPTYTINHSKKKKISKTPLTENMLKAIRKKHRMWQRYLETKDGQKYQEYCRARNKIRALTRGARSIYEKKIANDCKKNPKMFWNYVKNNLNSKSNIPDLDMPDGEKTTNNKQKADTLLDFFTSVFNTEEDEEEIPDLEKRCETEITDPIIDLEDVKRRVKKLNANKYPGPDGIHPKVYKELDEKIAHPLYMIFKRSLEEGKIPIPWKTAKISALHKKESKSDPNNYRPISLTCIACKMMESILRDHITSHMKENMLFCTKQYGFIQGRSTLLQLLTVLGKWSEKMDEGGVIDVIYMDFIKAFDKVPHKRLMNKLEAYGISGKTKAWIQDFLHNRTQQVHIGNAKSKIGKVTSGIPQGSVLGPLLFVIFINDMPDEIKSEIFLFADDTKIFNEVSKETGKITLQSDINKLVDWSNTWKLRFHPDKCKVLDLGRRVREENEYKLGTKILSHSENEKDVGVIMDKKLGFRRHMNTKINTANALVGIIRRSFMSLDAVTTTKLFKSMVRPHLEYCSQVWRPHLKLDMECIERVQNRTTRMIPEMKGINSIDRLKRLNLPCLAFRRLRGDMVETYKMLTGKYDEDVEKLVEKDNNARTRGHSKKLKGKRFKTDIMKFSFGNRIINIWNSLPETVISAPSLNSFKNRLDKLWIQKEMYYNYEAVYAYEHNIVPTNVNVNINVDVPSRDDDDNDDMR